MSHTGKLSYVPLDRIRENPVALRDVDKESEAYQGLVDSIKMRGVLNAINVREIPSEDGKPQYGLIDGLHRFNAAQDAGLKEIPAQIVKMEQAEVEEAQIVANVHKIETKPVEYTRQLERLMGRNPLLTIDELAKRLSKSKEWLYNRFGLLKLTEDLSKLVDDGKIKLNNAYQLSKLPKEEQTFFADRAMTMDPGEFTPTVAARIKEVKEARRQGRASAPPTFQAVAHARKWTEIKAEYENPSIGAYLVNKLNIKNPVDAFKLAVAWASNMDPDSQEAQKIKHDQQMAANKEAKEKRQAERAQQRAKDAAERAAKLNEEAKKLGVTA